MPEFFVYLNQLGKPCPQSWNSDMRKSGESQKERTDILFFKKLPDEDKLLSLDALMYKYPYAVPTNG